MGGCSSNKENSKIILVSCSGMCVHGQISAGAVHRVLYEKAQGKCDWVCPAAIPAGVEWQIERLKKAETIIAVPGCPALCDVKILKKAGIPPTKIVAAYKVCDFEQWGVELPDIPPDKREEMVEALSAAIVSEVAKFSGK